MIYSKNIYGYYNINRLSSSVRLIVVKCMIFSIIPWELQHKNNLSFPTP